MDPVISSYSPNSGLYETGPIIIDGDGFNSLDTRLLIDGIPSTTRKITNTSISATIPVLNKDGVYDIRVSTYSRYDGVAYSNPIFVFIKSIDNPKTRFPPKIIPDYSRIIKQESKAFVDNDSSSSHSSTSNSSTSSESSSSEFSSSTVSDSSSSDSSTLSESTFTSSTSSDDSSSSSFPA